MHQTKEPMQSVCLRIKQSSHIWLKEEAAKQERSATWLLNKIIEQAKETQHAKQA